MNGTQPYPETLAGRWEELASCVHALEQLSEEMISCPAEALADRMERRDALIARMQELQAACEGCEPPDEQQAARISAARDDARAAVCRLKDIDRQVIARVKREQQEILKKLRAVGKSAGAHASRFYQAQTPGSRSFFSGNM